jgi:CheY-like chemotaxis protein
VTYGTISGVRPTVLIVDDHAAFRASASALLQAEGFDVIGEASDGAGAVQAVTVLQPDIVLLDIQLPDLDGLAVAEELARIPNAPAVVLTSSRDAASYGPRIHTGPHVASSPRAGCRVRRSPRSSLERDDVAARSRRAGRCRFRAGS